MTIAISTAGASPALARRIREQIDDYLPQRLGELALALARSRAKFLASVPGFGARVEAVNRLLDGLELEALDARADDEIGEQVDRWIREVGS